MTADGMPTSTAAGWASPVDALRLAVRPSTLRKTIPVALIVGTILSTVNQGSIVLDGRAGWTTWVRVSVNYVVPLCVSTIGFLSARRAARRPPPAARADGA